MNKLFIPYTRYLLQIFVMVVFIGETAQAQLPEPSEFCSHSKSSENYQRTENIHYENHDYYDINFYHLNLFAETDDTFISGFVEIHAQTEAAILDTVFLELSKTLIVDSVLINHSKLDFTHQTNDILFFSPHQNIQPNEAFTIIVYYQGFATSLEKGRGYNTANSYSGTRVNWTLSEPFYSKDWWPCKQDLLDKADSVWVFVTTSNKNKVGSNGLLTASIPLENEKIRYEWKSNYPIAYYLISFAMAEYMEYSFYTPEYQGKEVWMQNYLYPDSTMYKSQKALIDCTNIQMNLLQEKYGEYPFINEKYGHCITPIGGGMEHQTMTTQANFSFHLTIHEMGHSWFGNQVTCAYWNDIWINEGFATYTQFIGLENLADRPSANAFMAAMQSVVMREPDGSVYVPFDEVDNRDRIFSGRLSYYKGATIIHMIRYLLDDDELFFLVLQEFQSRFAYQTATGENFKEILEEMSHKSFTSFFDLWYYGEGYPIYHFEWKQSVNNEFELKAYQEASTEITPFFDMKYDLKIYFTDGSDSLIQIHQQQQEEGFFIPLNKVVKNVVPNPNNWNLMDIEGVYSGLALPSFVSLEPNPAHDMILLRFANKNPNRNISIYSSALQLIEESSAFDRLFRYDISHLQAGVYFFIIEDGKQAITKKLVKY
ncbi:MAG: T9SS type A sorting domain-containing protein [Bacteroidales bacterium]|nr:T9SS type A sorting domain-containing protein [Bacteroidales bacterium]